jgi:hypothetical protein
MHPLPTDAMRIAPEITTRPVPRGDDEAPQSEVLAQRSPTGKLVNGATLEAAIQWRDCYLLLMTNDIPYEETLSMHLLDGSFTLLDTATLGAAYSTGTFAALELFEPDQVGFRFIGDTPWRIELLTEPEFKVPLVSDPRGVSRPFNFSRRFRVHGNPQPQTR